MRYSRVVAVLSGGGAKAAAHLGAIKALEEWGLVTSHYVGTSMGAVIAACFAAGLSYEEVLVRVGRVARRDVARLSPSSIAGPFGSHLLRAGPLRETIARLVPARRFGELGLPLTVTATDTVTGQLVLFGAGGTDAPLVDALYASCALPVFYPPGVIDGRAYADGGLRAVLPLDVAWQFDPDLIYAVNVGPTFASAGDDGPVPAMVRVHDMSTRILMATQIAETVERWRQSGCRWSWSSRKWNRARLAWATDSPMSRPGTGRRCESWRDGRRAVRRYGGRALRPDGERVPPYRHPALAAVAANDPWRRDSSPSTRPTARCPWCGAS